MPITPPQKIEPPKQEIYNPPVGGAAPPPPPPPPLPLNFKVSAPSSTPISEPVNTQPQLSLAEELAMRKNKLKKVEVKEYVPKILSKNKDEEEEPENPNDFRAMMMKAMKNRQKGKANPPVSQAVSAVSLLFL